MLGQFYASARGRVQIGHVGLDFLRASIHWTLVEAYLALGATYFCPIARRSGSVETYQGEKPKDRPKRIPDSRAND